MHFIGLRIIYLSVSALMTVPILFNVYKQNVSGNQETLLRSQPRKILEIVIEDSKDNDSGLDQATTSAYLDVSKGVQTKLLYEKGFSHNQSNICPQNENIPLLILITSAPNHEEARNDIRNTWGKLALYKNISLGFLIGYSSDNKINELLKNEIEKYEDIIQGNSVDSYDNLTLKTISALEWVDTYCPRAQFVLKTDDDVFINIEKLFSFVTSLDPDINTIYGRTAKNWKPVRNRKSKYFTSTAQYKPEVFPTFTTGPAYVFPGRLSGTLYETALNKIYFKLEDVFTTGLVAESLGIERKLILGFLNKRISFTPCNLKKHVSLHPLKTGEQVKLWNLVNEKMDCKRP